MSREWEVERSETDRWRKREVADESGGDGGPTMASSRRLDRLRSRQREGGKKRNATETIVQDAESDRGTNDARMTKRRDMRGSMAHRLGVKNSAQYLQPKIIKDDHRSRFVSIKLNPLETIPAASAALSTTLI